MRRQLNHLVLAEGAAVRVDRTAGHVRIARRARICDGDIQLDGQCRQGPIVSADVQGAHIGHAVGPRGECFYLKFGICAGIAEIDACAVDNLAGCCLAQVVIAGGARRKGRFYMNVAQTFVVVFDTGIRCGRIVQVIAVAPEDAVGDNRVRIVISGDAPVFRGVRIVDNDRAVGDHRRRVVQVDSAALVGCRVVGKDTVKYGRRRLVARYCAADVICEIIADKTVGNHRRRFLAIDSSAYGGASESLVAGDRAVSNRRRGIVAVDSGTVEVCKVVSYDAVLDGRRGFVATDSGSVVAAAPTDVHTPDDRIGAFAVGECHDRTRVQHTNHERVMRTEGRIVGIGNVTAAKRYRLALEVDGLDEERVRLGNQHVTVICIVDGLLDCVVEIGQVGGIVLGIQDFARFSLGDQSQCVVQIDTSARQAAARRAGYWIDCLEEQALYQTVGQCRVLRPDQCAGSGSIRSR